MKMQLSIWLEEPETDDAFRIAIKHINDAICLDSVTAPYHEEEPQEREASPGFAFSGSSSYYLYVLKLKPKLKPKQPVGRRPKLRLKPKLKQPTGRKLKPKRIMKPIRNRFYCPACNRTKMLFRSEEQAQGFIRWNAEEILEQNGKAPCRAYYCPSCLGWHLTSQEPHYRQVPPDEETDAPAGRLRRGNIRCYRKDRTRAEQRTIKHLFCKSVRAAKKAEKIVRKKWCAA